MGSTFGGLNIMSSSLYAQQSALNTVGHNIANADTEGYSRQSVNLVTASPAGEVYGRNLNHSGSGVTVASITRARDVFVDQQLRKESSTLGYSQTSSDALTKTEGVFTEPSDTGIQTVLNQFWTSWQTLATQASDSGARTTVAQRGVEVVNAVQHAAQQLKDTAENINSDVVLNVNKINQISSNIYKLNGQIANIEFSGTDHANDLRDTRDLLVDQLSSLVDISVKEDSAGNYNIQYMKESAGISVGVTLLDGNGYTKLSTKNTENNVSTGDPGYSVTTVVDENGNAVDFTNGSVKALIDSRDSSTTGIKGYMTSLETVSKFLLQDFNAVHKAGYGTDNNSGRNFFGADSDTDYSTAPVGGWINALSVNHNITDSVAGLAFIAAKTAANGIAVTAGVSNVGSATVSATGTYTGGATATSVRITTVSGSPYYAYSSDGGTTWSTPPASLSSPLNLQGMSITIGFTGSADGDTYKFTLSAGNSASGDNAIKLGNSLKKDVWATLGNTSLDAYYSSMIGALGVQSQDAQRTNTNQQSVVDQLTNTRQSTSGVNMDEEMTNMIKCQKGYNAAARVLTAMDEMLDKLINSTGMVGR